MGRWIIYDKTGVVQRCVVNRLEYRGTFMGACNVVCSIKSPYTIDFQIGDYLDYRGERFVINYDPTVIKQSSAGSIGNAFEYDGVTFNSCSDELVRCSFLDYVLSDNKIHFTSLPNFSFYASSVKDLADRIQANLDRIYKGEQKWTVNVHSSFEGKTKQNVSVNNINVWDALALANSTFKANFIIRGRTITIGTAGIPASKILMYGKDNGLLNIEQTADSEQQIITRLRAYGSSRNMPLRYYNKIGLKYFVNNATNVDTSRERKHIGVNVNLGDKFKKGLFKHELSHETKPTEVFRYKIKVRIDGYIIDAGIQCTIGSDTAYLYSSSVLCTNLEWLSHAVDYILVAKPSKLILESGVNMDEAPLGNTENPSYMSDNMAVNFLMLPGFPETTLDPYIDSKNITSLGIREHTVFFDGSDDKEEIFPSIEGMTADQLKKAGIPVSLDEGDNGNLDEVFDAEQTTESGYWDKDYDKEKIPNFTITIKDVGFDINEYLTSENAVISMKDGMCGGRDFEILGEKDKPKKVGNKWVLTCRRTEDSSLMQYFPNKEYNIKKGDKFVLLNIDLPDVYIKAASQKLLEAAKKYLSENDYVRYSYTPKVDDIFMARQHDNHVANKEVSLHDSIKEGDMLMFSDKDLNINGNVIIDSLTITEGESIIPHYEVTLRNEKVVGTIEKIKNQIDSLMSGNGHGGGVNSEQVEAIVNAIGSRKFLAKNRPDSTAYLLKLLGGAEVGEAIDSFIAGKGTILDENGRIQTDRLEVRNSLKVLELIINRIQGMENDFVFAPTRKVVKVEKVDDTTYKLTLDPLREGDLIPFREGNIIYSIVNDLLTGGSSYYTSYMRVLTTNQNEYSITVSLYPDSEVPGGKNYLPAEGYNVSRRGDVHLPEEGQSNPDAQSWYLSSSEGRLLFLQNVVKPVLEDYNYALSIGKFPRVQAVEDIGLPEDAVGVMAETIVAQHIYQYDYNGDVIPSVVDRGVWSMEVAVSDKPYRNITVEAMRPNGTKYTLLEQHAAWRYGCKWGCLVDKTKEEPKWNSPAWQMLEGNGNYALDFDSSEGWQFFRGKVDTVVSLIVTYGTEDITARLMKAPGTEVEWLRDSGNVPSDNGWKPTYVDGDRSRLRLDNTDMPTGWGYEIRKVKFICRIFIPEEDEPIAINEFGMKI